MQTEQHVAGPVPVGSNSEQYNYHKQYNEPTTIAYVDSYST